jgi:hypothetical protein
LKLRIHILFYVNLYTYTNEVRYSKASWIYLQVLHESFCLTKFSNMAMVRNVEVVLVQTLNHSVYSSIILCNAISL